MQKRVFFFITTLLIVVAFMFWVRRGLAAVLAPAMNGFFLPVDPFKIRGADGFGSGAYGASRDHGKRKHGGIDILTQVGWPIHAPISGKTRTFNAYKDGKDASLLKGVEISDGGTRVKLMYVSPAVNLPEYVEKGAVIGYNQSLQGRYPGIPQHIHFEVWIAGVNVDPTPFFAKQTA